MPSRPPREIDGKGRTIRELLAGRKYSIDYYQREYKWQQKQVADLIFSQKFGKRSFNLDVPERTLCMEALYADGEFSGANVPESVGNILARYSDLEEQFPEELAGAVLPYFVDWLIENVHLIEITAYSDGDALHHLRDHERPRALAHARIINRDFAFYSHWYERLRRLAILAVCVVECRWPSTGERGFSMPFF